MNSTRLNKQSNTKYELLIVCHLVLGLIVVHQVRPEVKDTADIWQFIFFRLSFNFKVKNVEFAALLLLKSQISCLKIDNHR